MCCGGDELKKEAGSEIFVENKDRSCTNCFCLIIFGVFWVGFIAVLSFALAKGDSNAVFYGTDYLGLPCNESKGIYIYYPQLSDDIRLAFSKGAKDIIKEGPFDALSGLEINLYGVCTPKCPDIGSIICNYDVDQECTDCMNEDNSYETCQSSGACKNCWIVPLRTKSYFYRCLFELSETTVGAEVCSNPMQESIPPDGTAPPNYIYPNDSRCLSKEVTTIKKRLELTFDDPVSESLMTYSALMSSWISDICSAWVVILLCGVIIPIAAGFLFVLLIKYIISCFIYLVYFLLVALSIFVCIFCFMKAGYFSVDDINSVKDRALNLTNGFSSDYLNFNVTNNNLDDITLPSIFAYDQRYATYWKVGAWLSLAFIVLVCLFIFFTWRAIKVVIGVIKEASNSLYKMPMLVFLPVIFIIQIGLVVAFFVASSAFLVSINNIDEDANKALNTTYVEFNKSCNDLTDKIGLNCNINLPKITTNDAGFYLIWFNLFGFLWTNEFINGIFLMVIAGAVAKWYFTKFNESNDKDVKNPICSSLFMVYRYHLGSIAYASLIVGIIKLIRYILLYIQKQTAGTQNRILKCILCCLQCCFWCLEKCMQFISRNAYIYIAIKGVGFCSAARHVFGLVASNMARFSLLNTTTFVIIFIGKLAISLLGGVLAYLVLSGYQLSEHFSGLFNYDFGNVFIPTGVTLLIAFYVAVQFLGVYSMIIDTILVCFLLDEQAIRDGTSDCMPPALRDAIGLAEYKATSNPTVDQSGQPVDDQSGQPVYVDDVNVVPN